MFFFLLGGGCLDKCHLNAGFPLQDSLGKKIFGVVAGAELLPFSQDDLSKQCELSAGFVAGTMFTRNACLNISSAQFVE